MTKPEIAMKMDSTKYLNRINYSQEVNPDLETLCKLQKAHLLNVPFENLDIHYGIPIELDTDRIFEKVVNNFRGGFCYELNGLFFELLVSLGFDAKRISARVFDKEKGFGQEFDHLAVIVNLNGVEYLADVGFGEFTFAPLEFSLHKTQTDPRGSFVIDRHDEEYFCVSKIVDGEVIPEYIFKDAERAFEDYKEMCRYHQTSSDSPFTQKRLISLPSEHGRTTISGDMLRILTNGQTTEIALKDDMDFENALLKYFRIKVEIK